MKTAYEEIVCAAAIGEKENPIDLNGLLRKAGEEQLVPAAQNKERILFLGVDVQQDFMENGALGVAGSHGDVERMTRFLYNHMDRITDIVVSVDTHIPQQIFHPCWWVDAKGDNPTPYTTISHGEVEAGRWIPAVSPEESGEYVRHLEQDGRKTLVVWPYHCIQGTTGCALENQFTNMIYFHSVAKSAVLNRLVKGTDPLSEMYGIIKPEYDTKNYINLDFLLQLKECDTIIIAGEAADYCVYESLRQMLDYYRDDPELPDRIYVLEDCMSGIGEKTAVDKLYAELQKQYPFHIVRSTEWEP